MHSPLILYMPMVAATKGTLSITAEARPMIVAMMDSFGRDWSRYSARVRRMPEESNAPTTFTLHNN